MIHTIRHILRPFYHLFQPVYAPIVKRYIQYNRIAVMRLRCREQIIEQLKKGELIRVMVGAARVQREGWITTDLPYLDMTQRSHWHKIFQPHSISYIVGEHVVEHLSESEFRSFLRIIPEFLTENANIRIAVPDGYHPDPKYIEYVRPGGTGSGADDHKLLYTRDYLENVLKEEGYSYAFLEAFDKNGVFHRIEWSIDKGYIVRCQVNDARNNLENPTAYTSLIVDFWKP